MKTRSSRIIKTAIIIAIAVVFFLTINHVPWIQNFTGMLTNGGDLFKKAVTSPFRASKFQKELESTQADQRQLIQENAQLLELREENTKLRKELNFYERTRYPIITARVIGRVKENNILFLILNRGKNDNIRIGQPVVVDGVLAGKITKVRDSTSVVVPLTAPTIKTAATFAGNEKTNGIVEGEFNVNLVMRFIPKDIEIGHGATVVTSGLEEHIPSGLIIGTIEYLKSNLEELFQTAYLNAPVRLEEIRIVSVITAWSALE